MKMAWNKAFQPWNLKGAGEAKEYSCPHFDWGGGGGGGGVSSLSPVPNPTN